jgi:hypothetical protein
MMVQTGSRQWHPTPHAAITRLLHHSTCQDGIPL